MYCKLDDEKKKRKEEKQNRRSRRTSPEEKKKMLQVRGGERKCFFVRSVFLVSAVASLLIISVDKIAYKDLTNRVNDDFGRNRRGPFFLLADYLLIMFCEASAFERLSLVTENVTPTIYLARPWSTALLEDKWLRSLRRTSSSSSSTSFFRRPSWSFQANDDAAERLRLSSGTRRPTSEKASNRAKSVQLPSPLQTFLSSTCQDEYHRVSIMTGLEALRQSLYFLVSKTSMFAAVGDSDRRNMNETYSSTAVDKGVFLEQKNGKRKTEAALPVVSEGNANGVVLPVVSVVCIDAAPDFLALVSSLFGCHSSNSSNNNNNSSSSTQHIEQPFECLSRDDGRAPKIIRSDHLCLGGMTVDSLAVPLRAKIYVGQKSGLTTNAPITTESTKTDSPATESTDSRLSRRKQNPQSSLVLDLAFSLQDVTKNYELLHRQIALKAFQAKETQSAYGETLVEPFDSPTSSFTTSEVDPLQTQNRHKKNPPQTDVGGMTDASLENATARLLLMCSKVSDAIYIPISEKDVVEVLPSADGSRRFLPSAKISSLLLALCKSAEWHSGSCDGDKNRSSDSRSSAAKKKQNVVIMFLSQEKRLEQLLPLLKQLETAVRSITADRHNVLFDFVELPTTAAAGDDRRRRVVESRWHSDVLQRSRSEANESALNSNSAAMQSKRTVESRRTHTSRNTRSWIEGLADELGACLQQEQASTEDILDPLLLCSELPMDIYVCGESQRIATDRAQTVLQDWQRRAIQDGEVLSDFGLLANAFLAQHKNLYDRLSMIAAGSTVRVACGLQLLAELKRELQTLYARQLFTLEARAQRSLRRRLLDMVATEGDLKRHAESGALATVISETARRFETDAADLLVQPAMSDELQKLFSNLYPSTFQTFAAFAQNLITSPAVRIQTRESRRKSRAMKAKQQRRSAASVRFGLTLVGMLRQDGYGNLQGFTTYEAGPLSLVLGYANDRDTVEATSANGEKPPFWRLQPKITIDAQL